jgi:serine phosphatase RsbU (regulator of sigma subunit)
MRNPFRIGSFEKRLLLFFLVLSVTPALLLAIFGGRYFVRSVELVSNPALKESFENSMEIARQLSAKLERDAAANSVRLAEEFRRTAPKGRTGTADFLRDMNRRNGSDFSALYIRSQGSWKLKAWHPETGARLDSTLMHTGGAGEPRMIEVRDQDVVASAMAATPDSLLVTGFVLRPGMMDMMRKTGDDLGRYSSISLYVRVLRRYMIIILSVLVAVMAITSAVVSRVLARRISYPIRELAHATDRIADGDLDHRVHVKAKDEIRSLVASFNNMTQELQDNKRNLIAMAKREAQVARDFEIARQVQQNLFPTTLPVEPGWRFAATCRPARAVGGDYYDIFEVEPGKVLFAQGDVSGKGLGASLVMASVHAAIRSSAGALKDNPTQLIHDLNGYLISSSGMETFVTLFVGYLDCATNHVWYVNCGHPPAVLLRGGNGRLEELNIGGPILGAFDGDNYRAGTCNLDPGDSLVLVSDGVTEAMNPKQDLFEMERLTEVIGEARGASARSLLDDIMRAVDRFAQGYEQADDISVMVLECEVSPRGSGASRLSADKAGQERMPTGEAPA